MTTPRDDISGLTDYLRKAARALYLAIDQTIADELSPKIKEAATQLDSLLKERDALQARVKEMTSLLATSEDLRRKVIDVAEQWQARALRSEQERDEAYDRAAVKVRDVLCCMDWPPSNGDDLIDTLQTAIRRLASPEKEKTCD